MAIGSRRSRERRRRNAQFAARALKWLTGLAIFIGLGFWSYRTGLDLARSEVTGLEQRIAAQGAEIRDLNATNARLEGELRQARADNTALQARYRRDVPTGDAAALFTLAQQRIASGLPRDHVEQVLRDAGPVTRCEARGTSKRFAIVYGGRVPDNAGMDLAEGLVRVVVSSANQTDDVTRTANVEVTVAGQEPRRFTGLPQRVPVTLGNAEMTLSVTSEIRGFATVSLTSC